MQTLIGKWRRFRLLSAADRSLLARAIALGPCTALGLRIVGFWRWKECIEHLFAPEGRQAARMAPEAQLEGAQRVARIAGWTQKYGLGRANCLERSLVLWWLLREAGIPADLRIGARKEDSCLEAHAWVEMRGCVLNDRPDIHLQFAPLGTPERGLDLYAHSRAEFSR